MNDRPYSPWLHRIALLTAVATFPLIFMGGLVTSHQAGMSVPDWPNSYGYNMFLFPPRLWIGGILYEHTHRLMGTVVGLLSIILTIVAWNTEPRRWVRWLATAVLGMVIFQGVLGGLRVVLVKLNLAIVHACVAQAFFCLAAFVAVVTSPWWATAPDLSEMNVGGARIIRLGVIALVVIYAQLIAGAVMRHYEAGLAVTDFPLIYGKVLPPTSDAELRTINNKRVWDDIFARQEDVLTSGSFTPFSTLRPVTLAQIWIHVAHRVGAVVVTVALAALIILVLRKHRVPGLVFPAVSLIGLLLGQLTLGILTVLLRKPADIASAHVAVGALTLMTTFVLTARACRLHSPRFRTQERGFEIQPAHVEPLRMRAGLATH